MRRLAAILLILFVFTSCSSAGEYENASLVTNTLNEYYWQYEVENGQDEPIYLFPENELDEPKEFQKLPQPYERPEPRPVTIERPRNAVLLSAHLDSVLVVTENGGLWSWGGTHENHVRIGDGFIGYSLYPVRIMENVVYAVTGESHSLAIDADGTLWAWGNNWAGQLGDGTTETRLSPVPIMESVIYAAIAPTYPNSHMGYGVRSFAITECGTLWAWGENGNSRYSCFPGFLGDGTDENRQSLVWIMVNVVSISLTVDGGTAVTTDGELWAWGHNWLGQLGDGTTETRLYPVKGNPPTHRVTHSPDTPYEWRRPIFELTVDGLLMAQGRNNLPLSRGQMFPPLGDGTTEYRESPVTIMENVKSFMVYEDTVYVITRDNALWGWGQNNMGQLGNGTRESRFSPVWIMDGVVSVHPFSFHCHGNTLFAKAFVITECGAVWAWGGNYVRHTVGRLGNGAEEPSLSPVLIIEGNSN